MPTGIAGFDYIAKGGLPVGRTTLVAGTAGAGKTLFAVQFLAQGIEQFGEAGVFVTFDERPADIRRNAASLGLDIATWESEGRWAFIDGSMLAMEQDEVVIGDYDFGGLVAQLRHAVQRIGAKRVSFDSLGAVFSRFADHALVRLELHRVAAALRDLETTSVITAERIHEQDSISRFGVEEFVADSVVVLRNVAVRQKRQRTVEVLKLRGGPHRSGEWLFTIDPGRGIVVLLLSAAEERPEASGGRVTTGVDELDVMCQGGLFEGSLAVVSGPTGTGKTLLTTHFVAAGIERHDRCLLLSFSESRDQIVRNANGCGFDLLEMEASGRLLLICQYPEDESIEDHFLAITEGIENFRPDRVALDNFFALERVTTEAGIRDILHELASFTRRRGITSLFTATSSGLLGDTPVSGVDLAPVADAIFLLRNVELAAELHRSIAVLKLRGSAHDRSIREFTIDGKGMHIGSKMMGLSGILTGDLAAAPVTGAGGAAPSDADRG